MVRQCHSPGCLYIYNSVSEVDGAAMSLTRLLYNSVSEVDGAAMNL